VRIFNKMAGVTCCVVLGRLSVVAYRKISQVNALVAIAGANYRSLHTCLCGATDKMAQATH
jgi:hypothetical protein